MSATNGSPVTGIIEEEFVIIDFGRYEGKTISEIAQLDQAFYEKLVAARDLGTFSIRRQKDKTFRLSLSPSSTIDH